MKATCTKNRRHKKFHTSAHVMEEWLVDQEGNWIETVETLQTDHGPDADNTWTCAICGADAKVER